MLHIIIKTNRFIPSRFSAFTIGFVVLIRPSVEAFDSLIQHELTHVRQFWHNPFSGIMSLFSKKVRQRLEVEAYRAQLNYVPCSDDRLRYVTIFAGYLSSNYGLDLTVNQARALLTAP